MNRYLRTKRIGWASTSATKRIGWTGTRRKQRIGQTGTSGQKKIEWTGTIGQKESDEHWTGTSEQTQSDEQVPQDKISDERYQRTKRIGWTGTTGQNNRMKGTRGQKDSDCVVYTMPIISPSGRSSFCACAAWPVTRGGLTAPRECSTAPARTVRYSCG